MPDSEPPSEPEEDGDGQIVACPDNATDANYSIDSDGWVRGGGLAFKAPAGEQWREEPIYLDWLYDSNSVIRTITPTWLSDLVVGQVLVEEGFESPKKAAAMIADCMASSQYYMGYTGRKTLHSAEYLLQGRTGWRTTLDIYVSNQGDIKGDVLDIIVLDIGEPGKLSVFLSAATIDHAENLSEVSQAAASLKID